MNLAFAGFRHSHIFGLYDSALKNEKVTVTGCFERDDASRQAVEKSHGITFNYKEYSDILNDASVDAVAIGDYYGIRGQMAIEALEHGKHVICDKPVCTSLEELEIIKKLATGKNLKVCCMLDLRYMPQIQTVKKLIGDGEIGKIKNVTFTGQHCLDYGNRPMWYFEKGKHGGTINDIAIHGVDLVRLITGKNLVSVDFAKTWNSYAEKEPDFKDCGQFMAQLEDGIALMADVSYSAPKFDGIMPTYWDFYFWGSEGMINFRLSSYDIDIYKTQKTTITCKAGYIDYLNAFMLEIEGTPTMMDTFGILETQRQVLEIQKAAD
ncbi:MAG: Gfo/Idh/MocA family oxidoreductase [Clostridia bacterium]|nr:Gfo/Idh/MocA family oxidoreductase [Clostridia bacterium]